MWLRITNDRVSICPECRQPCLKVYTYFDYEEYNDDDDDDAETVCRECIEKLVDAIPKSRFREL